MRYSKRFARLEEFFIDDRRWQGMREDFFRRSGLPSDTEQVPEYLARRLGDAWLAWLLTATLALTFAPQNCGFQFHNLSSSTGSIAACSSRFYGWPHTYIRSPASLWWMRGLGIIDPMPRIEGKERRTQARAMLERVPRRHGRDRKRGVAR